MSQSNLPPIPKTQLGSYLEDHLENELHWLLRAATEWYIQNNLKVGVDGEHTQVYAMDSAFMHARTLFEFFTHATTRNYYGYDTFHVSMVPPSGGDISTIYSQDWSPILHSYLVHAQDRSSPRKLQSHDLTNFKDLNEMPLDFAMEIVRLWREFTVRLGASSDPQIKPLEQMAKKSLLAAIQGTQPIYSRPAFKKYTINPIVW